MLTHPELNRRCFKTWYSQNAESHRKKRLAYAKADPQRHNAQCLAWKTFRVAQPCSVSGCSELGERHHEDYSKPKEIVWLCKKHHKMLSRI